MKKLFGRLGQSIHQHAKLWIGVIAVITVFLALGLPQIQMKMGNDVFVSPRRAIYKNSKVYQKHFGGDALYLLLNGSQKRIVSHQTMAKLARFNSKVSHVQNVKNTTSVINLVNSELKRPKSTQTQGNASQARLQRDLLASLSPAQRLQLRKRVQASLTTEQKAQLQRYTVGLLTAAQKRRLQVMQKSALTRAAKQSGQPQMAPAMVAQATQSASGQQQQQAKVQKMLTPTQRRRVQNYTLALLRPVQKKGLSNYVIQRIPQVQHMSTGLLRDLFLKPNGQVRAPLKTFFPRNGRHALVVLNTSSKSSDMSVDVQLSRDVEHAIRATHFGSSTRPQLAGQPNILGQVQGAVIKNMGIMLIFAVILMVLILALIFPVRRRILPLLFVLVCLDWTFGIMGWVRLPLTLATMATLPIIIGLGTDFGVQFLNRYEEEFKKDHNSLRSIQVSIQNMGTSVGIALIVMALSFMTMFLSKAPLMQKFGLTLAIGVICSYFVEMILIFSTLSLRDARLTARKLPRAKNQSTRLSRLLARYAGFVMKHAVLVLVIGLVLGAIGFSTEQRIGVDTQLVHMIPQRMTSLRNTKYLQRQIGSTTYVTYLVRGHHLTSARKLGRLDQLGRQMNREHRNVQGVTSLATVYRQNHGRFSAPQTQIKRTFDQLPQSVRQTLINRSHNSATLQFKVNRNLTSRSQLQLMNQISREIGGHRAGMTIRPAGTQDMMLQGIKNMTANRDLIIMAGLLIIFIVLFLVYRNWRLAIFPVVPIMIVLGLSPLTLFLLGTSYNPLTVALSSLVLGIGIEFTILIMERYREEIQQGSPTKVAITRAIGSVGQAITASGLTVIGGFVAIMFSSFPVLKSFGMITVLDTAYSLISALTVLPAFIYVLRRRHARN